MLKNKLVRQIISSLLYAVVFGVSFGLIAFIYFYFDPFQNHQKSGDWSFWIFVPLAFIVGAIVGGFIGQDKESTSTGAKSNMSADEIDRLTTKKVSHTIRLIVIIALAIVFSIFLGFFVVNNFNL